MLSSQILKPDQVMSFVGLSKLESINLSFTSVSDGGLRKLSGLKSLKSLNLDNRQITDAGILALTSKSFNSVALTFIFVALKRIAKICLHI